ncbi:class I adenylate-forming enzyme family protein [Okeania sp. SIO3I5]|uniref:class I adenylate-forming enzyme family protein n=1 Tax=Okeania sp. SIO3I5 TaxID=2607805 RepID=UPI0025E53712|nr:long-chain fatty acid--CoA ligase [Okeania sp. SIO3I5]
MMNITQHIERGAKFFPEKTALIFEDQTYSYLELNQLANRAANSLVKLGVKSGDRVALFLPNIPEFIIAYLGILKIGAVVVSVSAMLKSDEVRFILNDSEAVAIITTESLRKQVPDDDLGFLKYVCIADFSETVDELTGNDISLSTLMTIASSDAQAVSMAPTAPAAIVYTSGTTGFPKGATLSHGNVCSNMHSVKHSSGMNSDDKLLLFVPLFHCFGQNHVLNSGLNAGATIILQRRFKPEQVLEVVKTEGVTMFFGVPTVYYRLLEMGITKLDLKSIRYYFSAAAKMPVQLVRKWQESLGQLISEGYGLTETSPFACYNHNSKYKWGSIGIPIEDVEMKVVDEGGEEVESGEVGELLVRGPNVMLGYWNRPEETKKVLRNGWFHTGDLGKMDEDGYFYIVDRLKDMINVSGFNVYPSEVERVILMHPDVSEVAVYGVKHQIKGEITAANIILKLGKLLTVEDLKSFCSQRMATYKVPHLIRFVDSIPRNATGKVLKRVLCAQK